jgi:hypothetical protein
MRFRPWLVLVVVGSLEVTAIVVCSLLIAIYPGSLKWTAPVLCPADQPDAFVVRYHTQTSDGTGTNFTLFCMDGRGHVTEAGSWRPLGVLLAGVSAVLLGAALLLTVLAAVRRAGRAREPSPGGFGGPGGPPGPAPGTAPAPAGPGGPAGQPASAMPAAAATTPPPTETIT